MLTFAASQALVATIVHTGLALYIWRRRPPRPIWPTLLLFEFSAVLFSLGSLGTATSSRPETYQLSLTACYAGIIALPPLWVTLAVRMVALEGGREWRVRRFGERVLAGIAVSIFALYLTNDWHGQFLTATVGSRSEFHWGFWLHTALAYLFITASLAIFARAFVAARHSAERARFAILLAAPTVVLAPNLAYLAWLPRDFPDPTVTTATLAGCLIVAGIRRWGLFGLPTVALQRIVRRSREGILVIDERNRLVYANRSATELMPVPLAIGEPVSGELVRMLGVPASLTASWLHLLGDRTLRIADSPERWVEIRVDILPRLRKEPLVCIGVRDVTDLQRARGELQQRIEARTAELQRLAAAMGNAEEGILVADLSGRIEYANQAYTAITGGSLEDTIRWRLRSTAAPGRHWPPETVEALKSGRSWSGSLSPRRADGSTCEVEAMVSPLPNGEGRGERYFVVLRDVTEKRALELELRHTRQLESIGALAGGIAHDFNNILTAILGYTELARDALDDPEAARGSLREVLNAGELARKLVQQILAFSRRGEVARQAILLSPVVEEAIRLVRVGLPASIDIRLKLEVAEVAVEALPSEIQQLLINLVTNSAQAMRDRGIIEIRLDTCELDAGLCSLHEGSRPGLHARLSVRDSGCGMHPETLERIFEPYFTTKELGRGTGLGLAAVHGITRSLKGAITVASTPGHGSLFCVYLPLGRAVAQTAEPPVVEETRGSERVLLVEDEPSIREMLAKGLAMQGYRVTPRANAHEALLDFSSNDPGIDIVVTDRTMPGMSGIELIRGIRRSGYTLPVVLCSGALDAQCEEEARAAGATSTLPKPLTTATVAREIRRLLAPPSDPDHGQVTRDADAEAQPRRDATRSAPFTAGQPRGSSKDG